MTELIHPVRIDINAPRELVFEMAAAVGGSLPDGPPHASELIRRDGNVLVVRFSAPAPFHTLSALKAAAERRALRSRRHPRAAAG